jgi:hypothetical protein
LSWTDYSDTWTDNPLALRAAPFLKGEYFSLRHNAAQNKSVITNMKTYLLKPSDVCCCSRVMCRRIRSAVRALRPADVKPQEAALLDSLEREARAALDAIKHARTSEEVSRTRQELRRKLEESLGWRQLPLPPDLQVETVKTLAQPGFRIDKLVWQTLPGVRVPVHLYVPEKTDLPLQQSSFTWGTGGPIVRRTPTFRLSASTWPGLGLWC